MTCAAKAYNVRDDIMEKLAQIQQQLQHFHRLPALVICSSLLVLGIAILVSVSSLRNVTLMQQASDGADMEALGSLSDPAEQLDLALAVSRLKGVLGIRLFSPGGEFVNAVPAFISEATLPQEDLVRLKGLRPVSHFYPRGRLADIDLLSQERSASAPLLLVNVPLSPSDHPHLVGVVQFIIQGESLTRAFAALDRNLALQAGIVFVVGGGVLALTLWLAFRRIEKGNRLLAERTARLLQANQELALAAKSSAVGAVMAHLIHGLRNPLSGLQSFVNSEAEGPNRPSDAERMEAIATARRMQDLVSEVVRILGEDQIAAHYEITLQELVEILSTKMLPQARPAGVQFSAHLDGQGLLSNQEANLLILILENLIQNAIQATPRGKSVRLNLCRKGESVLFEVHDEGPGLPEMVRSRLFTPCPSSKEGGSGIGLAISKQLASHLRGELELKSSSAAGCVFQLLLPIKTA
ncbi:MAG: HAMP domain-containing sensor histidine kinase [Verrucomicrobia bacterium]|nr:HAMP domain-containing sensor histidine kinase [Verrucomicrobiota bacterium]